MKSKAKIMFEKYPEVFMSMFARSCKVDPDHPDDISVIYSKLMANAMGKADPYWTPDDVDMAPIYEDFRKLAPAEEADR